MSTPVLIQQEGGVSMYRVLDESQEGTVGIKIEGKFTVEDYKGLLPYLKRLRDEVGPMNLLFEVQKLECQKSDGYWRDLVVHLQNISGIHRMAVVGEDTYQRLESERERMGTVANNEIQYFPFEQLDGAWSWLKGE